MKYFYSVILAKIPKWSNYNNNWFEWNQTNALLHAIREDIRGCKRNPLAWRKLYYGIFHVKTKLTSLRSNHLRRFPFFLMNRSGYL